MSRIPPQWRAAVTWVAILLTMIVGVRFGTVGFLVAVLICAYLWQLARGKDL
jgi:hypothetical protein